MTIPASNIVNVVSNVLGNVGNAPVLNGVFLTQNELVPNDSVLTFLNAQSVGQFFGVSSLEYDLANRIYFNGYQGSILRPGALLIANYNAADKPAFLQSSVLNIPLSTLQSYSGEFDLSINGVVANTGALDLSTAVSFTAAAALIQTALGAGVTVTWNASVKKFIIETVLVGSAASLSYATDVTPSELAKNLKLTVQEGALLSAGGDEDTPESSITRLALKTTAWFSLTTLWEPVQADKLLFSTVISNLEKYSYICWDTDQDYLVPNSQTCTGFLISELENNNTFMIGGDEDFIVSENYTITEATRDLAVFVQGFVASVDFDITDGRATAAFRRQAGLKATIGNQEDFDTLISNRYNFYGVYANATNNWIFLFNGNLSGKFLWMDSFYGAVYLAAQLQTAGMELLAGNNAQTSIPYNPIGYSAIRAALNAPINNAINFGTIRRGVSLSESEIAIVNSQAGLDISNPLETNGYYLQIIDPSEQAKQNRESPIINFWYTDGQSVQQLVINATDIL
jgi:hypothetical protein